jgi:hypothetical protein
MNKNGEVKKPRRQRAIITITDKNEAQFDANIVFEPSIKNRKTSSPALDAANFVWNQLKNSLKGRVTLTDP